MPVPALKNWTVTTNGAAGAAVTPTKAADGTKTHFVLGFEAVVRTAATTDLVTVTLKDGSTALWTSEIRASANVGEKVGWLVGSRDCAIPCSAGAAVNLVISAPGGTTVMTGNIMGYSV